MIPPVVGRDLSKLTDEETEAIIAHQAKWPMGRLRRHQRLIERQLESIASGRRKADAVVQKNLQIRQRILDQAVERKAFENKEWEKACK